MGGRSTDSNSGVGGGQSRTLRCPCGWGATGSPREALGRLRLHARRCDEGQGMLRALPTFNADQARANGVAGANCSGRPVHALGVTVVVNGLTATKSIAHGEWDGVQLD